MEFFKDIVQKQDVETLYNCFRVMQLESYHKGTNIFQIGIQFFSFLILIGDIGTKYYILLKGYVSCLTPVCKDITCSPEELYIYIL